MHRYTKYDIWNKSRANVLKERAKNCSLSSMNPPLASLSDASGGFIEDNCPPSLLQPMLLTWLICNKNVQNC